MKKYVKCEQTYPSADVNSDYNLVVIMLKSHFPQMGKSPSPQLINDRKLLESDIHMHATKEMKDLMVELQSVADPNVIWEK